MKKSSVFILSVVFLFCAQQLPSQNMRKVENQPFVSGQSARIVDSIYNHMSMQERVAQLYGIRSNELTDSTGRRLSIEKCRQLIPLGIGHICQFACGLDLSPDELRDYVKELQHYLITETPSHLPAIFHEEAITGIAAKGATVYPQQIGVACTWNPELAETKTRETAIAMRSLGSSMALSPMADVIRTAHFPRVEESYGEDSYLCSAMGVAFVRGLQYGGLERGVAACSKHFLGYGGGYESADKELMEEILMPHEAMIRCGGSKAVMLGYHKVRGTYAVMNEWLIRGILRQYVGFDGITVSDYGAISRQWDSKSPDSLKARAVAALMAGTDMEFSNGICYPYLLDAIKDGTLPASVFEQAVKRALTMKVRLGMIADGAPLYKEGHLNLDPADNRATAYQLAAQSVVMLKNDGTLPLTGQHQKIALVGPNANTFWCMLGDYTYQSMYAFWWGGRIDPENPRIVPLREALRDKLPEGDVVGYERGCDWSAADEATIVRSGDSDPRAAKLKMMLMESADKTNWNDAVNLAAESDVVIAAVGENPTLCGESRERKGIRLPGDQERFVNDLLATGKPVVLVIFGGRPQLVTRVADRCAAILQCWYPGEEGGNAVADILTGRVSPSGKLCMSYPKTESKDYICYNYHVDTDTAKVLYPFGYGLSYTKFKYSDMRFTRTAEIGKDSVKVSCCVKNVGSVKGDEIVQLYLSPLGDNNLKPMQLKGFRRITLEPGESKRISFIMDKDLFAFYSDGGWCIRPGVYQLKLGASSSDIRLKGNMTWMGRRMQEKNRNAYFSY